MKSSVMERDIGPHEHKMVIFLSYEIYAVCKLCGFHDWSTPKDDSDQLAYLKAKYPNHEIVQQ